MFINWDMKSSGALCFRKFERNNAFAFSPGAIRARPPQFCGNVISVENPLVKHVFSK
jgi:hypothetical protein